MPNVNHTWSADELTDILALRPEDFFMKYSNISADAYRLRRAKETKKVETFAPVRFTGDGQYEPTPWDYAPGKSSTKVLERHVILSDIHGPYVNQPAFKMVLDFTREFKPTHIDIIGDCVDFFDVSRYTKDPLRKMFLGREVAFTIDVILAELRAAAPKSKITWVAGNHEDRLTTYLANRAPELASLPSLDMRSLFETEKLRIIYTTSAIELGDTVLTHGHMARKGSGATARAMLDTYGRSVVHGHTHRLGAIYKTSNHKTFMAFENGCLCSFDVPFIKDGMADWQLGYSVAYLMGDGRFRFEQISIPDDLTLAYGGRLYGASDVIEECHDA